MFANWLPFVPLINTAKESVVIATLTDQPQGLKMNKMIWNNKKEDLLIKYQNIHFIQNFGGKLRVISVLIKDNVIFKSEWFSPFNRMIHGLFELQKHGEEGFFFPHSPILSFVLEQQWCSDLVSSFTVVQFMKIFRTMNGPRPLDWWRYLDVINRHKVNNDVINT